MSQYRLEISEQNIYSEDGEIIDRLKQATVIGKFTSSECNRLIAQCTPQEGQVILAALQKWERSNDEPAQR